MKYRFSVLAFAFRLSLHAQASDTFSFPTGPVSIPDNNPNGYQNSIMLAQLPGTISDVNVTLNIAGGFNGDLYVWLSHGSNLAVLLNRVGVSSASSVGYPDAGFGPDNQESQFTFDDQATQDVHFYQSVNYTLNSNGQLTGTWQPDGRIIDPYSPAASFDSAPRSNLLDVFNGADPNGQWTLFVADLSPGGISTLTGWGLEIETVPEPSLTLLFGIFLLASVLARNLAKANPASDRRQQERC
jgi:subtilisin-like proprotein convertase family protein